MRSIYRLAVLALVSVAAAFILCPGVQAASVEQVQVCMPAIDVFLYEENGELSNSDRDSIRVLLDGEEISVDEIVLTEQGIFYVYMLDVSASMPQRHFDAAKAAILQASVSLREQDSLALLTFGNEVTQVLYGGESREQVEEILAGLTCVDSETAFYTAMDALLELMEQTDGMRRIGVVISDGIDDTEAGMTQQQLEEQLVISGVSVSAMCIDTSAEANVEAFRSFIRLSGGELFLFGSENADEVLTSLSDRLSGVWRVSASAGSNLVDGQEHLLEVCLPDGAVLPVTIKPERWHPDEKRPRVDDVDFERATGTFLVTFSEPVSGAESAESYSFTGAAGHIAVAQVEPVDDLTFRVYLEALPTSGNVTLSISGLTDVSMEENELYGYSQVVYSAGAAQPAPGAVTVREPEALLEPLTVVLLVVMALLLAAGVVAICLLSVRRKRGEKKKKEKKRKERQEPKRLAPRVRSSAAFIFVDEDSKGGKDNKGSQDGKDDNGSKDDKDGDEK